MQHKDKNSDLESYLTNNWLKKNYSLVQSEGWVPSTDVLETETHFVVIMDLSGIDKDKLVVKYEKGLLTVEGIRPDFYSTKKIDRFHKKEIDYGLFCRKVKIKARIIAGNIHAQYQDGILHVELEKDKSVSNGTIEIKVKE